VCRVVLSDCVGKYPIIKRRNFCLEEFPLDDVDRQPGEGGVVADGEQDFRHLARVDEALQVGVQVLPKSKKNPLALNSADVQFLFEQKIMTKAFVRSIV
jgi:hypothetical protein